MTKPDLPKPIYAAAGAGELAYQQLRKLPEVAKRTVRNAGQLRQRFAAGEGDLNQRLRESAARGRTAVLQTATAAQQRAAAGYRNLIARGERVVAERANGRQHDEQESPVEVIVGPVQPAERPEPPQASGEQAATSEPDNH